MITLGRITVAVFWAAGMVLLTTWSYTDGAIVAAAVLTVFAAALIGSWWILVIPLVPATTLIAGSLLAGSETDADGWTGFLWAAYIAVITTVVVLLLALGIGVNRLVSRTWRRHGAQGLDGQRSATPESRR